MEILVDNFAAKLNFMVESVLSADFIAIDSEFSGLNVGYDDQANGFDQSADRYQKLKHNCQRMNAFQFGVCCFKWDAKRASYSSRPFNVYVWPHSEVLGDQCMQFKASNIRFLMKHNFDFNKLFTLGVNYQRLADQQLIREKIAQRTDLAAIAPLTSSEGVRYNAHRAYTAIGTTSRELLEKYMRAVANFALMVQETDDQLMLEIPIASFALRRRLSQELHAIYHDRDLIFTQFSKASHIFTVRKWRPKPDDSGASQQSHFSSTQVKVSLDQLEDTPYDRIIKGQRDGIQVVYEDEHALAFLAQKPVAQTHVIVLDKSRRFGSLAKLQQTEADELLVGRLMVTAAKVAR